MRLRRFRIKNYRSIIDAGWNSLATDNITGIIGQNESGKTSILEALISFYTGEISDDILRSDLSLPIVSCSFECNPRKFRKLLGEKKIPEQIQQNLEETGSFTIVRRWRNDKSSHLTFGDEKVSSYFETQKKQRKEFEVKTDEEIDRVIIEARKAEEEYSHALQERASEQKEFNSLEVNFSKAQKAFNRSPSEENRNKLQKKTLDHERSKKRLEKKIKVFELKSAKAADLTDKAKYAQWSLEARSDLEKIESDLAASKEELSILKRSFENAVNEKEINRLKLKINQVETRHNEHFARFQKAREKEFFRKSVVSRIFKGMDPDDAEDMVEKEMEKQAAFYTERELAELSFKHIPVFEMFEDFSSLLPNRIDLEDIFSDNAQVEGIKAVRNFLIVAGLMRNFFDEHNNRILKQKIEKLNSEITLDFQDYWRQNLGKQNKIKINFELEHYDSNHPNKMGKPYLEFWIKDDVERLYPKQRSRGVRWFLSFYLELKASAIENKEKSRVFLIDEPGLSLHARAQEDVLKLFEDIKEDIQIIYTTHSPHLINMNKLYRLLAVQRAVEDDMKSETLVFDSRSLNEASTDTLSPIYTLIGTQLSDHQFVKKKNNVIVEDTATYHYLKTIFSLFEFPKELYLLPATDVYNVPTLVNLLMGWKLDFVVLLDDDNAGNLVYNDLKMKLFNNDDKIAAKKLIKMNDLWSIEDLFSTIDFKNFVLHRRIGITESNSEYIENNNISRSLLASSFVLHVQNHQVKYEDFDDETRENIENLVQRLNKVLD